MKLLERLKAKQAKLLDYVDKGDLYGGTTSIGTLSFPAEHQKVQTTNQKMLDVLGLPAQTFEMSVDFPLDTPPYCTCSFYLTEAQLQAISGSTALKVVEHGPTYPYKPFKIT